MKCTAPADKEEFQRPSASFSTQTQPASTSPNTKTTKELEAISVHYPLLLSSKHQQATTMIALSAMPSSLSNRKEKDNISSSTHSSMQTSAEDKLKRSSTKQG